MENISYGWLFLMKIFIKKDILKKVFKIVFGMNW